MFTLEEWRDAPGYEGLYQVSDHGRVRALVKRNTKHREFLKPTVRSDGYLIVGLFDRDGVHKNFLVHRLVLTAFRGPNDGLQAAHLNGQRSDNRLGNLVWATVAENHAHKRLHGTNAEGVRNPQAKLTDEQVRSIRREYIPYSRTHGSTALAMKHGTSPNTVWAVVKRKLWKHVA